MKIYVSHATNFDYNTELYEPLKGAFSDDHQLILPHESGNSVTDSKESIQSSDLVVAEVSYPSTGQGIELGWADEFHVPIICIHRSDKTPSGALHIVSDRFINYSSTEDLVEKLRHAL